jgi:hypothetical protein
MSEKNVPERYDDHDEYVERNGVKYPWVEVKDSFEKDWVRRVLIADLGNYFITPWGDSEDRFESGGKPPLEYWSYMRPLPRKKYRPYASLEECKHLIGEVLIAKFDASSKILVSSVRVTLDASRCFVRIVSNCNEYTMSYLLDHYTHNGQPCGVEV